MIIGKDYVSGFAKRKEYKGYPQYNKYEFGELFIDKIEGKEIFRDSLIENYKSDKIELYYNALKRYFSDFELLDEKTDEEIYGDICKLREEYFGIELLDFLKKERISKLKNSCKRLFSNNIRETFLDILFYDIEEENKVKETPIDEWGIFIKKITNPHNRLIVIPGHYLMLPPLFHFLSKVKKDLILLLKDKSIYNEPVEEDLNYIDLKGINITTYTYRSNGVGLNLATLDRNIKELFEDTKNEKYEILGLGEIMLFSLHGAVFPYFIATKVKNSKTKIYTNLQSERDNDIPFVLSYVNKREPPAEDFLGMERVKKTLYHFVKIKDKPKDAILPYYFNFYSTTFSPDKFSEFKVENEKDMIDVLKKRDEVLSKIIKKCIGQNGKYLKTYYDLETYRKKPYPIGPKKRQNGVLLNLLLLYNPEELILSPLLSENLGYNKVSPRVLIKNEKLTSKDLFYFNFLYFFTGKLIKDYNYIRRERPQEKLKEKEFFLGYRYTPEEEIETFPLYNKGFFGYTKNGLPIFGRRTLEGGKIKIGDVKIYWKKEAVNTDNPKEFCIYTPFIKNKELSGKSIDYMNFSHPVGDRRFNIVIVNNKIITIREGDVFLPCVGVVLSFHKDSRYVKWLKNSLSLKERESGYYEIGAPYKIKLTLDPPQGIPSDVWDNVKWVYGGGTLLVDEEINLVKTKEDAYKSFVNEGWYHPLSKQTQETQVQKWVRNPRNIIGISNTGTFFVMTFSGRTKESIGVNFKEAVDIAQKELFPQKIKYALNLDGGSSVCLGFIYKKEFFELNYPAPSPITPAGMVRPVNSMVIIRSHTH